MNKKMIVYILGKMMGVEGLLLLIPALVSLIYHEKSVISFLIVAAILLAIYMVFGRKLPASKQMYRKRRTKSLQAIITVNLHSIRKMHSLRKNRNTNKKMCRKIFQI